LKAKSIRKIRVITQIASFVFFLYLFVQAVYLGDSSLPSDLFYKLDPLIAASAMIAGRALKAGFLYAILNIAAAIVFGRVWCGWMCPFGSVLEWLSPNQQTSKVSDQWRTVKFLLFIVIITAAVFGNQTLTILDPISILTRSMTTVIWPGLRYLIYELEGLLYRFEVFWPALDFINEKLVLPLFLGIESVFIAAVPIFVFLLVIIGLNWISERFWCRYLCPLGGMLGLTARLSVFRRNVNENCIDCGKCVAECPTGTIDKEKGYISDPAECIVCFDCAAVCPSEAITFPSDLGGWKTNERKDYDPSRRQILTAMSGTLAGIALAGIEPIQRREPDRLIRPPGGRLTDFSAVCMRCGECVRVCPTQGLQPSLLEGGWQNLFTPRLVPRLGYCSYNCDACLRTCPTGAIPPLSKDEKQKVKIGIASINTDRCLPWAYDTMCSVCEEMCPLPEKAITLEPIEVSSANGQRQTIFRPRVNRDLCIGCGICEYHCPVGGEAAIQVKTLPNTDNFIPGI